MKRLKLFICLFILRVLLVITVLPLVGEFPVSPGVRTEGRATDTKIESIINQVREYCEAGNFEKAHKHLNIALEKFPQKEYREMLQIERADVHLSWALSLEEKYDYVNAIKHFEMAYTIDKSYRPKGAAIELNFIGFLYNALGQKQKALEYYENALPIYQAVGNHVGEATVFNNIGLVYSDLGQNQKALEYHKKALSIYQAVGNRAGEATILYNIGFLYSAFGQKHKALEYYEKALPVFQAVGDRASEAMTLNNIGLIYSALGRNQKALEYYEKALPISQAVGDRASEATTLYNVGFVYSALGQKQEALEYYEKALPISQAVGDRASEATTLTGIGLVYSALGRKQKALEYYEKALPISQAVGDRAGEAMTLNNIGAVYSDLGRNQKALEYYEKALPISQAVGDRAGEAATLNNIGLVFFALGRNQKALVYYGKALPILQTMGDRAGEATTLTNIGTMYSALGQKQKALEYYEKALPIFRAVGDRAMEATTLNNIGLVFYALGRNQKALEYYERALPISQAVGDRTGEATTLNNIGLVFYALGRNQKALEYFEKALSIIRAVGDRAGEAMTFNNIGAVYSALGKNQKALEYFEKALPIIQVVGSPAGEAATLNNIGGVYLTLGQNQKALEYFEKALPIIQAVGGRAGEATTLNNIGGVYFNLGRNQKALAYYEKVLPILQEVGDRAMGVITLSNLMICWKNLKNIQLSIFCGKLSVNACQILRANISALDKKNKQSYLEKKKHTYRYLADILIDEGRIPEAQHVLDMLKEEEFFQFIRRDRSYTSPTYNQLDFNTFEKKWLEEYKKLTENLSEISGEYFLLKNKKIKNDAEKKRMEQLETILEKSRKGYHRYLLELKAAFAEHNEDIKNGKYKALVMTEYAHSLQSTLKTLDQKEEGKSVALNFLVYEGKVRVILTTPDSQLPVSGTIEEKKLNRLIIKYREAVRELRKTPRGEAGITSTLKGIYNELYEAVFKPVDKELKKYGATNLMIFLDGVLRYIPLPALWDGETYLVQRYRMTLFTISSLTRIKDEPGEKRKILGLGASGGGSGFGPLPNVKDEIRGIVNDKEKGFNGLIHGKAFLDKDFTQATFLNQLKTEDYSLVHISSHFKFSPGDETKNYLLMGDGSTMTLAELRYKGNIFHNVELLMLAACETGVGGGNGMEIDGFGELAQQSGAQSVVASLWKVRDESTKELMVKFYRILKEGKVTSKIEALRQAQLELAGLKDLLGKNNPTVKRKRTKYAHPYYWGPFIMIGNWR